MNLKLAFSLFCLALLSLIPLTGDCSSGGNDNDRSDDDATPADDDNTPVDDDSIIFDDDNDSSPDDDTNQCDETAFEECKAVAKTQLDSCLAGCLDAEACASANCQWQCQVDYDSSVTTCGGTYDCNDLITDVACMQGCFNDAQTCLKPLSTCTASRVLTCMYTLLNECMVGCL